MGNRLYMYMSDFNIAVSLYEVIDFIKQEIMRKPTFAYKIFHIYFSLNKTFEI
ncbi:hypothetical protein P4313_24840 [Bacillus tropicus]|uniref:hypothetical protein n=1 Tax=Bacillus tropicus TaxID=2026188 RepID=UPI002E200F8D|nr:hypothetical protein [Bacillus tropicus]